MGSTMSKGVSSSQPTRLRAEDGYYQQLELGKADTNICNAQWVVENFADQTVLVRVGNLGREGTGMYKLSQPFSSLRKGYHGAIKFENATAGNKSNLSRGSFRFSLIEGSFTVTVRIQGVAEKAMKTPPPIIQKFQISATYDFPDRQESIFTLLVEGRGQHPLIGNQALQYLSFQIDKE